MKRGMEVREANRITEQADGRFSVSSQTHSHVIYEVRLLETIWACTCPDFGTGKWIAVSTFML